MEKKVELKLRRLLTNCIDIFCEYDKLYNKIVEVFGDGASELQGISSSQSCVIVRIRTALQEAGVEPKLKDQVDYLYWLNGVLRSDEDSQTKAKYLLFGRKDIAYE